MGSDEQDSDDLLLGAARKVADEAYQLVRSHRAGAGTRP